MPVLLGLLGRKIPLAKPADCEHLSARSPVKQRCAESLASSLSDPSVEDQILEQKKKKIPSPIPTSPKEGKKTLKKKNPGTLIQQTTMTARATPLQLLLSWASVNMCMEHLHT